MPDALWWRHAIAQALWQLHSPVKDADAAHGVNLPVVDWHEPYDEES